METAKEANRSYVFKGEMRKLPEGRAARRGGIRRGGVRPAGVGTQGAEAQGHSVTEENASPPSGRHFLVLIQIYCRRKKQRSLVV